MHSEGKGKGSMKTNLEMKDLAPLIREVVGKGGSFRLYPRGVSMLPLLREGIDSVKLGAPETVKKGDVVFYLRENGEYVLHRVIGKHKESFTLCGDAQLLPEHGIRRDQIFAKAIGFWRGEEYIAATDRRHVKYAKRRMRLRRLRRVWRALRSK